MKLRMLSAADVRKALPMPLAIQVMQRAFAQFSAGRTVVPLRTRIQVDGGNLMFFMPAFLKESRELGLKVIALWPDNSVKGLADAYSLVTIFDVDTGKPLAIMNGEELTAIRTGAGGGLAADLLARPESSVVAVFGSGVQARAQLEAVCAVRPIREVRIVGRTPVSAEKFAAEIRNWPDLPTVFTPPREEAVAKADIIITATTSNTPVFKGKCLSPGTHITAVGSYTHDMQEVDSDTIRKAKIVVDSLEACLAEAGDLIIPIEQKEITSDDIYAELGQIVNGDLPGRENPDEITYFKSVGIAAQDAASGHEIYRIAKEMNLGQLVEL
ncbi:MAG: Ornithine cyclodeaminase [Candidatus Magnetoglobus multicellularis str. Araruama]|uniref:Ornithine cyclodeaminase n=1 Tax=Candidatus Magnetoglobus multicellularis str. Araruama TaxID=890399 RepID=A0A1V1P0Y0_9BACT|nr:MAG: Ornithine cyclodeaminase [Candidatus Magnetoglobus multicellularis str. Araruama]